MKNIGRIFGDVIGNKFSFASREYFEGDYIKVLKSDDDGNSAALVCEVVSRGVSNKFLSTPEVVKYLDDTMDFQIDTIYTYSATVIGIVKNGTLSHDKIYAIPGKKVFSAEADLIRIVYGIKDHGEEVGYLKKMPDCKMVLNTDKIFNPHLFIVGKTGSGKSYFMKNYISKVKDKFWLFAPSDEYSEIVQESKIKMDNDFILDLDIENISYYINLNASEEIILKNVIFLSDKIYSNKEIIEEVYNYYRNKRKNKSRQLELNLGEEIVQDIELPAYANSLISKLKNIRHLKFTNNKKKIHVPKESTIFDLGKYTQLEQECILNFFLYRLLQQCKRTKLENRKKQIVIIEEAHNYVPSVKNTLSKEILVRLSREGRKYGISLCFITQRPRYFDQTALSQSGNKIIFSLPNPDDVKHIMEDIPYYRPELAVDIQCQKTGECIIAGDAYNDILEVNIGFS